MACPRFGLNEVNDGIVENTNRWNLHQNWIPVLKRINFLKELIFCQQNGGPFVKLGFNMWGYLYHSLIELWYQKCASDPKYAKLMDNWNPTLYPCWRCNHNILGLYTDHGDQHFMVLWWFTYTFTVSIFHQKYWDLCPRLQITTCLTGMTQRTLIIWHWYVLCITEALWVESSHQWIPLQRTSDIGLRCVRCWLTKQVDKYIYIYIYIYILNKQLSSRLAHDLRHHDAHVTPL